MATTNYREPSMDELLRQFQQRGLVLQSNRPIRDEQEAILSKIEALHNSTTYIAKVQYITELYASALPHLKEDGLRSKVETKLSKASKASPNFQTSVSKTGSEGAMLHISLDRATKDTSALPLDSPEHMRIYLEAERENAHMRIYFDLLPALGDVMSALVADGIIPKTFDSKMREIDLSVMDDTDAGKPEG